MHKYAHPLFLLLLAGFFAASGCRKSASGNAHQALILNDSAYFEARGLNVMVFSNWYDGSFDDAKISGVEIIHHGVRTVTNGDVRLNPTPGQWDAIPEFVDRTVDRENQTIEATLRYPKYDFQYRVRGSLRDGVFHLSVHADQPLPAELVGLAGLNLEFLPSAYFGKAYAVDDASGLFPLHPSGDMQELGGENEPLPLASGACIDLAPDDPTRHVTIQSLSDAPLMLFDGRNKAQNGWFVVRSLLPENQTGLLAEWRIEAETVPNWTRPPVVAHSQVGYHPKQQKRAVVELDPNDQPLSAIFLQKIDPNGQIVTVLKEKPLEWGRYLRYRYLTFDFSDVQTPGLYRLQYGDVATAPFRIAADVYQNAWQPTMDVYLPIQMDHMLVREAYRVWHGVSHLDDALQAPVNHSHFDLYAQGPTTGNRFRPLQHIPGLNVGGWYDAGDYDIRTQTNQAVILELVRIRETFHPDRDQTTIDQRSRYVEIHRPDGQPDILQQIEHGVLQLLAQQDAVGYALNGIIAAHLYQYRHLGDGLTKTDNLIYNPRLDSLQSDGRTSGAFDDRWAFTNRSTPLNYGSAAALAAAARVLGDYNPPLAARCLRAARRIWADEHSHDPYLFSVRGLNTIGGMLLMEELRAALELFRATADASYRDRILELLPTDDAQIRWFVPFLAQTLVLEDAFFKEKLEPLLDDFLATMAQAETENPFRVRISTGGWAGNGGIISAANTAYLLHRAFPDRVDKDLILRALDYLFGCHPDSDISFVSAVGAKSKRVAYGNNRADFTYLPGGIVPGILILKPDFPENKEDWPFFWGENEYVVNLAPSYVFLTLAANDLLND
jgi:hypothetical protein